MTIEVVEDQGVIGFGIEARRGFVLAAVEAHVLDGAGFDDDEDDVSRALHIGGQELWQR